MDTSRLRPLFSLFVCFLALALSIPANAQDKTRYANIQEALFNSGNLSGESGPSNVVWINGGQQYSYTQRNSDTNASEIRSYDPASGEDELIFSTSDFNTPGTDETFQYDSFQWTDDSRFIVFQSNFRPIYRRSGISDYYYYEVESGELNVLVKDAMTAELSPDGSKVGYEREGDLYVYDLDSETETQLTDSGAKNFYNGRFGWVYEEEFGLAQAWSWSHDSQYIAYWQTDERDVKLFMSTDYSGTYPEYVEIPYPKVGADNPKIKIGVVNVESGENEWMDLDLQDGYIPRLYWTARPGTLATVWLNRPQNHLKLHFFDVQSGEGDLIMEEQNENGWIDVFDFFAGINHYFTFPKNLEEFFWVSERDGYNHIYRYDYSGELTNQVTDGEWEVTNIHAINPNSEYIYYTSTEVSPLERHLYSIKFDGSNKQKHTRETGTHSINMDENGTWYIDRYSSVDTPRQVELWSTTGEMVEKLVDNSEVSKYIEQHVYAPKELFTFTTSDGQELDGSIVKPIDFDPSQSYPLLLNIYGGPGAQGVYNSWESSGWVQYLAQQGYVIANVNNRGSGGYGGDFEKIVYKNLGHWEAHDFAETAKYLSSEYEWVDESRIGIRGHSYGGYMSSFSILTHPNVFQVAIVGAPVTDWRLYDTIYTERYMGLLENNEEGYAQSAPTTHAPKLQGKMFIAHSSMDENVHVQNTMQFVKALTDAGKDADLRIYPPGAHGVAYNRESYVLLYKTYTEYLEEHLKNLQ
ncbi:S9 family peptidase [Gracilimonas mengyeensis]|uniref:Dipeptidyl-peptidase-4 n=1 Tax=Gracilimonas mengyeensis TaxID=1302730 RepID=A0A521BK54_9BACT|nr:S9 family peptidase [Gracilimonas mengyeensis]SMO47231.1 dipeptidyl-peptidase-4 [Gracilimonas mengyeensis]